MPKLAIIDYGMGNLRSVEKAFLYLGSNAFITNNEKKIKLADKLVLPGVGAFAKAVENLKKCNLFNLIKDEVTQGKPLLGICLGLQLLFSKSYEFGETAGLDLIKGEVKKFNIKLKVPHLGWNQIKIKNKKSKIFKDIADDSFFYFVHSYYVSPQDKKITAATTDYETCFVSAIEYKNIFATQFHPEKSQENGLQILKNFARM